MGVKDSTTQTGIVEPSLPPKAAGRPVLIVIGGPEIGRRIEIDRDMVEIGREEGVAVLLEGEGVSRRHATIRKVAGNLAITDTGSTNGTLVNGKRIVSQRLIDGDRIRIGKVILKYVEYELEAQYHEQVQKLASVDGLTGAFNKRYFDEGLVRLIATRVKGAALSLIVFDIDQFKKVNDTWGHGAGDVVLKEFAEIAGDQVRFHGALCRIGGDEFAVLLRRTDLQTARGIAEKVRAVVEKHPFVFDGARMPVTTSVGVAEHVAGEAGEAFFKRADGCLYDAKNGGRNRVC